MKRVAGTEDETVVGIPAVVGLAIVAVEPQTIVIVLHVEDVQIAVRVAECIACHLIHCPSDYSPGCMSTSASTYARAHYTK